MKYFPAPCIGLARRMGYNILRECGIVGGMSQRLVRYIYYMLSNDTEVDRRSWFGSEETWKKEKWKKLCVEIPRQDCGLCVC